MTGNIEHTVRELQDGLAVRLTGRFVSVGRLKKSGWQAGSISDLMFATDATQLQYKLHRSLAVHAVGGFPTPLWRGLL